MANYGASYEDWRQYGDKEGGGGLGATIGAYLADKAGLIDLSDPTQQKNALTGGLQKTIVGNFFNKQVPGAAVPKSTADYGSGANYALQPVAPPNSLASRDVLNPPVAQPPIKTPDFSQYVPSLGDTSKSPGFLDGLSTFAKLFL